MGIFNFGIFFLYLAYDLVDFIGCKLIFVSNIFYVVADPSFLYNFKWQHVAMGLEAYGPRKLGQLMRLTWRKRFRFHSI